LTSILKRAGHSGVDGVADDLCVRRIIAGHTGGFVHAKQTVTRPAPTDLHLKVSPW